MGWFRNGLKQQKMKEMNTISHDMNAKTGQSVRPIKECHGRWKKSTTVYQGVDDSVTDATLSI